MLRPAALFSRRTALRAGVVSLTAVAMGACATDPPMQLRLAAGEVGGFFWEFSGLLSDAAAGLSEVEVVPLTTSGSLDNLDALISGRAELAMTLIDAAYSHPSTDLAAVGCVYENYFQVAVRADSTILAASDLRGRRVSTGAPGSGATVLSHRILDAAGVSGPDAVREVQLSMKAAATALSDNEIDAVMWAGGLPTPAFAEPSSEIRLLELGSLVPNLRRAFGTAYEAVPVPANVYGSHPEVTTVGIPNLLLAHPDVPNRVVAALVSVLLDRSSALVPGQAIGSQFLDARSLVMTGGIPLHPGAEEEYRARHG
ncbi:TAXI family TRAP transporter solute-binding subunit [Rhodococcus fascians]|jgi:TRAP transporter TAXI family solute receptor|uniref:TAXI family TRAP transporter solute-binding subunit n=1 Tax=Nocardiaceae TaxID=85025 RepID=UPI0019103D65|nr:MULTISPECIES: TAXI family TRAP transporter solute-binding subunit [Rhodococcus]MDP9635232.1 TRAP transporter TAXI family solute receptor [Rhodococcus cercidiphylli]MBY3793889.1 TAXI family TRAP transporter solute-binding subunit [Rhodococcus fascians]MBY3826647.1 TAXI family TRAP transporter solute-binding subunit [Rhodococcus fascians]MBY3837108.1 TAXI family TRAP transporter solute-binding subunit [Rhodococcus fascians]MBY3865425.1 TAXI family TRAP transporter solute-binding subunit [Rhod